MNANPKEWARAFIELFGSRSAPIASRFYNVYRDEHPAAPEDLVRGVMKDAKRRYYDRWASEKTKAENLDLARRLKSDRDEAVKFAQYVIWRENLTPEEHARLKAIQAEEGRRAWMETQPPTEKQINYLRLLGYEGEVESRGHASQLIDELREEDEDEWS